MDFSDFIIPDPTAPLDVDAYLDRVPEDGRVKGFFMMDLLNQVPGPLEGFAEKYTGFKDYPLPEYARLVVATAKARFPDRPLRAGITLVGRRSYAAFAETMLGRVMFGSLGRNISAVLRLAGKAYEVAGVPAKATVVEMNDDNGIFHLTEQYVFLDSMQVGVWKGGLETVGYEGEVLIKPVTEWEAYFLVRWTP